MVIPNRLLNLNVINKKGVSNTLFLFLSFIISDRHSRNILKISDKILLLKNEHLKQIQYLKELQQHNYLQKSI